MLARQHEPRGGGGVITIYEPCREGQHGDCIAVDDEPETRPPDLAERCACTCHPLDAAITEALNDAQAAARRFVDANG